jgi:hypothetical protein
MAAATAIAIFIIPSLFVLVERLSKHWSGEVQAVRQPRPVEGD